MSRRSSWVLGTLAGLLGSACSGQTPAPEQPENSAEPAAEQAELPGEEAEPTQSDLTQSDLEESSAAAADESEPAAPPQEPLASLCNKMCDAVAPKCTPLQVKGCRSTCDSYETHPAACDGVVRTALECARADKDFLFCANVVPDSCAKEFKAINVCNETGKPPEGATAKGMPAGWERFKGPGFSVVVPKGMKSSNRDGIKAWSVKAANGITYEVAVHAPPEGAKLDNRAFLRAGNRLFGKCSPKLKLHALVEKPGHTSIQ